MENLKQEFKDHVKQDAIEFRKINEKLDQIIGQWKLIGAVVGILGTIATGWLF